MNWLVMLMGPHDFLLRIVCAMICGIIIGIERQLTRHPAGLRTNTLVSLGSALFVVLSVFTAGDNSPTRIAGQIVTGIGFLGAGVIMRSGLNIRGLNTAGTIWCSSACGTLAGSGYYCPAIIGAVLVLATNTLMRPLVNLVDKHPSDKSPNNTNEHDMA